MRYMTCNQCQAVIQVNSIGICLGCQLGAGKPLEDVEEAQAQIEADIAAELARKAPGAILDEERPVRAVFRRAKRTAR